MAARKPVAKEENFEDMVKEAYGASLDATLRLSMLPLKLYTRSLTAYVRMVEQALENASSDS